MDDDGEINTIIDNDLLQHSKNKLLLPLKPSSTAKLTTDHDLNAIGTYRGKFGTDGRDGTPHFGQKEKNMQGAKRKRKKASSISFGFDSSDADFFHRNEESELDYEKIDSHASLNLTLQMTSQDCTNKQQAEDQVEESKEESKEEGMQITPIQNEIRVYCYVPPKYGQPTFASFSGRTGFLHDRGYMDTTLTLGHQLCLFRSGHVANLLCDWHTRDGTSKVRRGCYIALFVLVYS